MSGASQQRPTFASAYALQGEPKSIRLLDCLCFVMPPGDPEYLGDCGINEFAVMDAKTLDKAIFERPNRYTDDQVTGLITKTFGATARQIARGIWFV